MIILAHLYGYDKPTATERLIEQAKAFARRERSDGNERRAKRHDRIRAALEDLAGRQEGGGR